MTDIASQLPLILLTAATLAYGIGPFLIDMNRTHLLHPKWPGHARFHLLWASVSQLGIAGLSLWLIWFPSEDSASRFQLAAMIGLFTTSGFWVAMFLRKIYGGTLHDPGGIPPLAGKIDGNIIAVCVIQALLIGSLLCPDAHPH